MACQHYWSIIVESLSYLKRMSLQTIAYNMPDPLSVAASAAGIASLGIQVCQGLIAYLRLIEGRKQEVSHGLREIQTLVSMFYSLNNILPQVDQRGVANSVIIQQCLKDSEKSLLEFQQLLIKLRGPENQAGIREMMKEAGRLLTFPFCKEKLASLRDTLQRLLDNLNSAINIASLYESCSLLSWGTVANTTLLGN